MPIAFTKNCIVSSVRLQFSHYFYRDPENISLARDQLFQLLTMVDISENSTRLLKRAPYSS